MEFIKNRRIWYTISIILTGIGLLALLFWGLNFGIDFTGGTIIEFKFDMTNDITRGDIEEILGQFDLADISSVTETSTPDFKGMLIRTKDLQPEQIFAIQDVIQQKYTDAEMLRTEQVGPSIGQELRWKALLALSLASLAIVIYISFRFQFRFAIASIIALLHDVAIVLSFFAIFQWQLDTTFVAAILTIVGYSINDTIVIFDRIRENQKLQKRMPFDEMCNLSIVEMLPRSLKTGATTLLTIIALIVFGGASLKIFMVALFIGIVAGTYSSICIASPILVTWEKLQPSVSKRK